MKKRDVFLDFTSLLDVTLIVIFFFVLFSTLDTQEYKKSTDAAVEVATQEAKEKKEEYEEALAIIVSSSERKNKEEIVDFNQGKNLKIFLDISNEEDANHHKQWSIRVAHGTEMLGTIKGGRNISEDIYTCISDAGYNKDDTILCDLIMDMNKAGSHYASLELRNSIDKVKKKYYSNFYVSETDISIGGY